MKTIKQTSGAAVTQDYEGTQWLDGAIINATGLNNMEQGIARATRAVQQLQSATIEVKALEAGEPAAASYANGHFTFAVPKGDQGEPGEQGPQGPQGEPGADGAKGETGETGKQGPKGDTGAAGPAGAKGDKGDRGEAGAKGEKGEKGDTGARGGSFRFYNKTATASGSNTIAELKPDNSVIPVAVGDVVMDSTKKFYTVTAVSGSNWTASAQQGSIS